MRCAICGSKTSKSLKVCPECEGRLGDLKIKLLRARTIGMVGGLLVVAMIYVAYEAYAGENIALTSIAALVCIVGLVINLISIFRVWKLNKHIDLIESLSNHTLNQTH